MNAKQYLSTNQITFTQQCESGQVEQFNDKFAELVTFAEENNIKKPKKQDLLTAILKNSLPSISPQEFFKS